MAKKWTATKSLFLSRMLTIASMAIAVITLFCIPYLAEWYDAISGNPPIRNQLIVCLYISDALGILALWQLHRLLRNINLQRVFVSENAACFRLIAWCCFAVAGLWLFMFVLCRRFHEFIIAFMAAFAGLIIRVIKNLLEAAVELREENDYTI